MLRSSDSRLFLLLEGDSDVRSLKRLIDDRHCTVVSSHGKPAILRVMARLEIDEDDLGGCAGLVDRDFDHWMEDAELVLPANVFTTELYDREADLLLRGGLLDAYLEAMFDSHKAIGQSAVWDGIELRSIIVKIAASIGRLRWASVRDVLKLRLSRFPIDQIIDDNAVVIYTAMMSLAVWRTENCELEAHDILDAYSKTTPATDEQEFCCGHDLIRALAATSKCWAIRVVGRGEIETFVAGAVRCDILHRFRWFNDLKAWSKDQGRQLWNCAL